MLLNHVYIDHSTSNVTDSECKLQMETRIHACGELLINDKGPSAVTAAAVPHLLCAIIS
jgi:hypothetical protein